MSLPLTVVPVPGHGAEDVLVDAEGWVLTGTDDGAIFRVRPDGGRIDRVGDTGGRPLGLELLPDGRVLVCDARRGLLALDPRTGDVEELTTLVHGQRMAFCNNAAVQGTGDIWFTDSSRVYGIERWKADLIENTVLRTAAAPVDGRDGRGGARRAAVRERRGARGGRVVRRRGRDRRPDRRTTLADRPPAGRDRPPGRRTCRATRTTSAGAATGSCGSPSPRRRTRSSSG